MGFFEDMKNSLTGSNNSSNDFDNDKFDSSFTSGSQGQNGGNSDLKPHEPAPPEQNGPDASNPAQQSPPQNNPRNQNGNSGPGQSMNDLGGPGSNGNSNPQAGSPQPGSSEPQVSDQTRKEMENAGFNLNDSSRNQQRSQGNQREQDIGGQMGNSTEPVSSQKDDIQEIKSQNEQIIELLKRISDSLQHGSGSRSRGNEPDRNRRHGGRR